MKKNNLLLWMFILGYIASSCSGAKNKKNDYKTTNDSIGVFYNANPKKKECIRHVIHYERLACDSIIGNYHILFKTIENGQVVTTYPVTDGKGRDTVYYASQDVILSIRKGGNDIVSRKTIQLNDFKTFIPKEEISKFNLSNFSIKEVRDNEIAFDLSFCIPETDIYYPFELIIFDNGNFKITEIVEDESEM